MDLNKLFGSIERTMLARFDESSHINHNGDKGENREEFVIEFLKEHLPKRYGVVKGEVITSDGRRSHAIDIIIYDTVNCPILYSGKTAIIPIEGVYGIIEVKSSLSKAEFLDALKKIESFKQLAPRDLAVIVTEEYATVRRPSRPFGIVLGFQLAGNSLNSLESNLNDHCHEVHNVNYFCNLVCVLGNGLLRHEQVNLSQGEKSLLLDTDEFVKLVETILKRKRNDDVGDEILTRIIQEKTEGQTFGRFFTYLLILLTKMKINAPDLGRYIDRNLPLNVFRE